MIEASLNFLNQLFKRVIAGIKLAVAEVET